MPAMRSARGSLFVTVSILVAVGVVMIYSASAIYAEQTMGDSYYYLKRHIAYLAIGIMMMLAAMAININTLRRLTKPLVALALVLLLLVLIPHIGRETGGARRWFRMGPVNFQPSEFAKFVMILYMADIASRKKNLMKSFLHGYLPPIMVVGLVAGLILLEPDLGTAVATASISMLMLFVAGVQPAHIGLSVLAFLPALYVLLFSVPYRRKRMLAFVNPWADKRGTGFQIIQSFIALGSGGLFGLGLGQSRQKLFYLPASHTDFIFSIIGEELGFIGAASVVILFMLFIWQGMKIVFKAEDPFMRLVGFGIVALIALEAVINIGVVAGALPTKGLPLPFISYGGSALAFHLAAVGVLMNIAKSCEVYR